MIFSSLTYLIFLSITVVLYWSLPYRFRVPLLLLASYVFYMSWSPPNGLIYGPLIFLDSFYFYWLSRAMVRWPDFKKKILIFGVTTELALLIYFKYANFLGSTGEAILRFLSLPVTHVEFDIFLPLAISFTNFILISYLVDVYRGDEKPDRSFIRFATYVAFFPHLIAGPIVRAKELLHQFDQNPPFKIENLAQGIHRFATGFFLKVFIADIIAVYVNMIFGDPNLQGFNTSWIALYSFAIQIFCDFFGYTLMAQGSALLMGYKLPENFDAPYFAKNVSDFWKRWHMSLSRWLRDYLYIPLGGSHGTKFETYRNVFITMALGGLWHGASWNFVIWGILQSVFLSLYLLGKHLNVNRYIPPFLAVVLTFHAVCLTRVFFRAQTFEDAIHILNTLFNPFLWKEVNGQVGEVEKGLIYMSPETALSMVALFFIGHWLIRNFRSVLDKFPHPIYKDATIATAYGILLYFIFTLGGASPQEFIYFQF